tara:strand:+ start:18873 stop:19589 length:717 start_codon:yes stop_codon:yes gene_type:complete
MIAKIDIILAAYEELRISGLTSKPNAEEVTSAARRLDSMMMGWNNKNLCVGYKKSLSFPEVDTTQDSGLKDTDFFAVAANLAKNLCASFGKVCHPQTLADAKEGYDNLFSAVIPTRESNPYLPRGSGRSFGNGFTQRYKFQLDDKNAPDNCETLDIKVGEIAYFPIDFNHYLTDDDSIHSYVIDDSEGVSIISSEEADGIIIIKAEGLTKGFAAIKITVTTTYERVNPETINFNVTIT